MKYYLDFEFNGMGGLPITFSLIRQDNVAVYLGFRESASIELDPWVQENVIPHLNKAPIALRWRTIEEIHADLTKFFAGDKNITIITDWPDDVAYFSRVILTGPGTMIDIPGITFEVHRVDAYPTVVPEAVQHNAFWDAMALKAKIESPELKKKEQFITTVDTLVWEYVGDISQDIEDCSYNEEHIREMWNAGTLDSSIKAKMEEYPSHFDGWAWNREDGRYADNLTALVISHGGWPTEWGPFASPLTDEEKTICLAFLDKYEIVHPPGEEFILDKSTAENSGAPECIATYIFNMPAHIGLPEKVRELWNKGQLNLVLNAHMRVNEDFDFAQFARYDGRYAEQLTYFIGRLGYWPDGSKKLPLTEEEKLRIKAFNFKVVLQDK